MSPSKGEYVPVRARLDSGADANFVTQHLVNSLGLVTMNAGVRPVKFQQMDGHVTVNEETRVSWSPEDSDNNRRIVPCYVLPLSSNPPEQLTLGGDFMAFVKSEGIKLLDEEPTKWIAYAIQSKRTVSWPACVLFRAVS